MTEKTSANSNLHKAKKEKNDEFYTQLSDIENELKHYKEHFRNKVIFCNCDDPYESNFFKYFAWNFKHLGLKKLIAMGFSTSPIADTQLRLFDIEWIEDKTKKAYKIEMTDLVDANEDWALNLIDVEILAKKNKEHVKITLLKEDWDFRSEESLNCLKEADIVVTNPPFSLFKEYVPLLINYNKKFLIIWSQNAITYKEIFKYIKENKIWLGFLNVNKFIVSDNYENKNIIIENWKKIVKFWNISWFTNLEHSKRNEEIILYEKYSPEKYPKYETIDAIDVDKVSKIPIDYFWIMWVPKTFMNQYNPKQFEILGYEREDENIQVWIKNMPKEFLEKYREFWWKWHYTSGMKMLCFYDENWKPKIPFSRILIKRKK